MCALFSILILCCNVCNAIWNYTAKIYALQLIYYLNNMLHTCMTLSYINIGGGVLSALAARRPELSHSIVLVEPPLFFPFKRFMWAFASLFVSRPMAEKYHPLIEGTVSVSLFMCVYVTVC